MSLLFKTLTVNSDHVHQPQINTIKVVHTTTCKFYEYRIEDNI